MKAKGLKGSILLLAAAMVVMAPAGISFAGSPIDSTGGSVAVSATIKTACNNFSAGNMDLQIDPSTTNTVYSSGSLTTIQCTKGTSFNVSAASAGAGGSASTSGTLSGKLKATGLDDVSYTLYFSPTFTGGGFGSATASTLINGSGDASHGVNVAASAAQAAQAGSYSDSVTLTISY